MPPPFDIRTPQKAVIFRTFYWINSKKKAAIQNERDLLLVEGSYLVNVTDTYE